jgi:chromate reductase
VQCEGGYVMMHAGAVMDNDGKQIKKFTGGERHFENFIEAMRSGKREDLHADVLEGHISTNICHTGNVSYRLGHKASAAEMRTQIGDLPLYNQDDDANQAESVKQMKNVIKSAQGALFVTPEYNRSIPGVLKNAIDHASRPYGQSAWTGKPAGVLGVSPGATGTAMAQQHLRNILATLDMPTLGQPEAFIQMKDGLFEEDGSIGAGNRKFLQNWMDRYAAWVKMHTV